MSPLKDETAVDAERALLSEVGALFQAGHMKAANEKLSQALKFSPNAAPLWLLRGMADIKQGLWKEAESDFSKAHELDPADLESWLGIGLSMAMQNKVYPALEILEEMLSKHPGFVRGHVQIARLYFKLCATNKGRDHLKAALSNDPSADESREIEIMTREENLLDHKRYHRPDFVLLRRQKTGSQGLA